MYWCAGLRPNRPIVLRPHGALRIANVLMRSGHTGKISFKIDDDEFQLLEVHMDQLEYSLSVNIAKVDKIIFQLKGDAYVTLYGHITTLNCDYTCDINYNMNLQLDRAKVFGEMSSEEEK